MNENQIEDLVRDGTNRLNRDMSNSQKGCGARYRSGRPLKYTREHAGGPWAQVMQCQLQNPPPAYILESPTKTAIFSFHCVSRIPKILLPRIRLPISSSARSIRRRHEESLEFNPICLHSSSSCKRPITPSANPFLIQGKKEVVPFFFRV